MQKGRTGVTLRALPHYLPGYAGILEAGQFVVCCFVADFKDDICVVAREEDGVSAPTWLLSIAGEGDVAWGTEVEESKPPKKIWDPFARLSWEIEPSVLELSEPPVQAPSLPAVLASWTPLMGQFPNGG